MSRFHVSLIFIILSAVSLGLFSFVNDTRADTSSAVIMTVKISVCGNNALEGGEQCDGNNFGNKSCAYLGYDSGAISCGASCEFDASDCNTNAEETATATFTSSAGGSETISDGEAEAAIDLPANFYSDSLRLEMFSHPFSAISSSKPAPSGKQFLGSTYNLNFFDSSGNAVSTLSLPATITITYTDADANGIDESGIKPYKFEDNGSSWELIPDFALDTETNTVTLTTSSFSWFTLFGSAPAGSVSDSNYNNANSGGRRRLADLPLVTYKNIASYIDNILLNLNLQDNKSTSSQKLATVSKTPKTNTSTAGDGNNLENSSQVTTESKLKIILGLLILIGVILARFAPFL